MIRRRGRGRRNTITVDKESDREHESSKERKQIIHQSPSPLSRASIHSLLGCNVTAGIECIYGSAIYLMTTGIS